MLLDPHQGGSVGNPHTTGRYSGVLDGPAVPTSSMNAAPGSRAGPGSGAGDLAQRAVFRPSIFDYLMFGPAYVEQKRQAHESSLRWGLFDQIMGQQAAGRAAPSIGAAQTRPLGEPMAPAVSGPMGASGILPHSNQQILATSLVDPNLSDTMLALNDDARQAFLDERKLRLDEYGQAGNFLDRQERMLGDTKESIQKLQLLDGTVLNSGRINMGGGNLTFKDYDAGTGMGWTQADDQTLMTTFLKVFDPNSAAMEGELQSMGQSDYVTQKWREVKSLFSDAGFVRLTEDQRRAYVNILENAKPALQNQWDYDSQVLDTLVNQFDELKRYQRQAPSTERNMSPSYGGSSSASQLGEGWEVIE